MLTEGSGGIFPVVLPIAEPAVGYGAVGAVAYFHGEGDGEAKPAAEGDGFVPPSITFVGGAATDNGTRAVGLGHFGVWKDGKIRYLGAVFGADANLTFYGEGDALPEGLDWNIEMAGTVHQIKFEVAPRLFVGAQYYYISTDSEIGDEDDPDLLPFLDPAELESDLAGLGVLASYDTRNTTFTPTDGLFANLSLIGHDEVLGSDFNYFRLNLKAFNYWDLDTFVLGLRLEGASAGDGAPFYGLPYIRLRGIPAFRYLGRYVGLGEFEPTWRVTPRWHLVGFVSAGKAAIDSGDFSDAETIVAGGGGFRYLLARKLGLAVGIDVGWGPEDTAVYFIIGSYWVGL